MRGEPRFTRDVDVALVAKTDGELERLVLAMRNRGYEVAAIVEQETVGRLSTVRLASPSGLVTDLLAANCGIEPEIVERAAPVDIADAGPIPVARAEELLAMKLLSMSGARPQDRMDATGLLATNPAIDLVAVRANLALIEQRGFHRGRALGALLDELLASVAPI